MVHKRLSSPHLSVLFNETEDLNKDVVNKNVIASSSKKTISNHIDKEYHMFQEELFDKLWEDTAVRIRALGVNELMVNKHVTDVQKQTFPILLSYDDAINNTEEIEVMDNLGAAVQLHIQHTYAFKTYLIFLNVIQTVIL